MAAAAQSPEVLQLSETIDYTVKHPLQNTWTLWFDNPGKKASAQSWADNLKEIINIDTVEDFWRWATHTRTGGFVYIYMYSRMELALSIM